MTRLTDLTLIIVALYTGNLNACDSVLRRTNRSLTMAQSRVKIHTEFPINQLSEIHRVRQKYRERDEKRLSSYKQIIFNQSDKNKKL